MAMIINVMRATCDRCGASVEKRGKQDFYPQCSDLLRDNVGWAVLEARSREPHRTITEERLIALCPECAGEFAEFLGARG